MNRMNYDEPFNANVHASNRCHLRCENPVLKRAPSRSTMTLAVSLQFLQFPWQPLLKAQPYLPMETYGSMRSSHYRPSIFGYPSRNPPFALICIDTLKPPVPAGLIKSFVSLGGNFAWIWEPVTLNVSIYHSKDFKHDFKAASGHLTWLQSEDVCLSVSGEKML